MKNYIFTFQISATLLLVLAFNISILKGQTFEWIKSQPLNYEYNPDMLNYAVAADEDGNVFHAGLKNFTLYYSDMYGDVFINKYNASGEDIFSLEITGNALVKHLVTANGKIFITGTFTGDLVFPGQQVLYASSSDQEFFIAIISENGLTEYLANLSVLVEQLYDVGVFCISENAEIYLPVSRWSDSRILKMDFSGNILQTIQQDNVSMANSVDLDPSGNIVVSGAFAGEMSYFGGELYQPESQDNMYVAKYSPEGENLWVSFALDVVYSFHNQIKCDNSGNIYFSGVLHGEATFGNLQANGPNWVYDFFLTKLNPDGEFVWLTEVPEGEITGDASVGNASFLDVDEADNVYVSGFVRGNIDWGNGVMSSGNLYYDLLVMQFSPEGIIQWSKSGGSPNYEKCIGLSVDNQGNCYMAGIGGGTMVFDTITHYQEGFVYPYLIKLNKGLSVDISETNIPKSNITIFPNPATDQVGFSTVSGTEQVKLINVYDLSGGLLLVEAMDYRQSFSVSGFKSGMYLVELVFANGKKIINKLTVR